MFRSLVIQKGLVATTIYIAKSLKYYQPKLAELLLRVVDVEGRF